MVKSILRKGILLGVGTVFLTKDAIDRKVKDLLTEARRQNISLTPKEAQELIQSVIAETKRQQVILKRESKKEARAALATVKRVSGKEMKVLRKEVASLRRKLAGGKKGSSRCTCCD